MLKTLKKYKAPYLFILPFFILFFVFQLVPTSGHSISALLTGKE